MESGSVLGAELPNPRRWSVTGGANSAASGECCSNYVVIDDTGNVVHCTRLLFPVFKIKNKICCTHSNLQKM